MVGRSSLFDLVGDQAPRLLELEAVGADDALAGGFDRGHPVDAERAQSGLGVGDHVPGRALGREPQRMDHACAGLLAAGDIAELLQRLEQAVDGRPGQVERAGDVASTDAAGAVDLMQHIQPALESADTLRLPRRSGPRPLLGHFAFPPLCGLGPQLSWFANAKRLRATP